jgi:restriction endonuclease S subunit
MAQTTQSVLSAAQGELPTIELEGRSLQNRLRPGDVLFRTRGATNLAVLVEAVPDLTVALSPLVIIRSRDSSILDPGYLHWVLNSEALRDDIEREARGTIIRMVGAKSLQDLQIPLPPIARQRNIAAVARMARHERELEARLQARRQQFAEQILWRSAQSTG